MCLNHLLNLLGTAHENPTPVVDMLGLDLEHPLHFTVHGFSTRILHDHRHGRTFIQNPQLALRGLLVGRVREDAAIQQRAVRVSDHAPDVPCRVGLATRVGGVFERFEVGFGLVGPVGRVAFVNRVDGAFLGDAHVRVG